MFADRIDLDQPCNSLEDAIKNAIAYTEYSIDDGTPFELRTVLFSAYLCGAIDRIFPELAKKLSDCINRDQKTIANMH